MEIREIQNKELWEEFLSKTKEKTFLQSWNSGELNQKIGHKIWRLGIFENSKLLGISLVLKIKAKRGTFLFIPHGPIFLLFVNKQVCLEKLLIFLKELAKQEKASFIRIAPISERNEKNTKIFKDLNFRQAPIHIHPELTWQLDINLSEEELLMNMRKTTRYLIRKAKKNQNISARQSANPKDLEIFNKIYQQTAKRHGFSPFSQEYIQTQFETFLADDQIRIFLGEYNGETLVASIAVFWQGISFYHHGASLPSKAPVSYLTQWEIIQEAKKRGCQLHNFWGVAETDSKKHAWHGLSLFKKGFGGYQKSYIKTQDYIISQKYWFNFLVEIIRKKMRRL